MAPEEEEKQKLQWKHEKYLAEFNTHKDKFFKTSDVRRSQEYLQELTTDLEDWWEKFERNFNKKVAQELKTAKSAYDTFKQIVEASRKVKNSRIDPKNIKTPNVQRISSRYSSPSCPSTQSLKRQHRKDSKATDGPEQKKFKSGWPYITPEMALSLKNNTLPEPEIIRKQNNVYVKAFCVFCEEYQELTSIHWAHHVLNEHTGEFAYKCLICNQLVKSDKHCRDRNTMKMYPDLKKNDLTVFLCGECNFLQVNENNMKLHMKSEHAYAPSNYTKQILLKARCHLDHNRDIQNHSAEQQNTDPEQTLICEPEPDNKVAVRPWIQDDNTTKPIINTITQLALYKCMYDKCIFVTNRPGAWNIHMKQHTELIDLTDAQNCFNKNFNETLIECPYCDNKARTNSDAIYHIEASHHRSIFQCVHCFHRTNEMENIAIHYETFHQNQSREVLLCDEKREFKSEDYKKLTDCFKENVEKIKCGQVTTRSAPPRNCQSEYAQKGPSPHGCDKQFVFFDELIAHLHDYHEKPTKYTCPYCSVSLKCEADSIQSHLKMHNLSIFQCIYCKSGFENVSDVKEHMSRNHSSQFLFVAIRQPKSPRDVECPIVYVGDSRDYSQFSLYKCSDPKALLCMDPNELRFKKQFAILEAKLRENGDIIVPFSGAVPAIDFINTSNDFFIKYDENVDPKRPPADNNTDVVFKSQTSIEQNIKSGVDSLSMEPMMWSSSTRDWNEIQNANQNASDPTNAESSVLVINSPNSG